MDCQLYTVCASSVNPYENLALEEYLLTQVPPNSVILYLWQNEHTVVIGRNQNPWTECRTALLSADGGYLARRLSGGGAVYHDLGNLNFTFLCNQDDYDLKKQLSVIQKAVSYCGIHAEFSGRNDLLADGRKFSGNAFYHSKGKAYHHGTLLVSTDAERLTKYLSPPKAKLESKGIASVRSRVVNLQELSPTLTCQKMQEYMLRAFEEIYGGTAQTLFLSDTDAVIRLQERYSSEEWLFGKPMPFSCTMDGHFSFGNLQLQFSVEQGIITGIRCYTDAMDSELPEKLSAVLTGCAFQADAIRKQLIAMEIGEELSSFIQTQL